jgi:hypothetical protein
MRRPIARMRRRGKGEVWGSCWRGWDDVGDSSVCGGSHPVRLRGRLSAQDKSQRIGKRIVGRVVSIEADSFGRKPDVTHFFPSSVRIDKGSSFMVP